MELFRSLLFVPGNRSDMLEKASTADTDILVPDMEDSVPDNEKSNARSLISEKLETLSGNEPFGSNSSCPRNYTSSPRNYTSINDKISNLIWNSHE